MLTFITLNFRWTVRRVQTIPVYVMPYEARFIQILFQKVSTAHPAVAAKMRLIFISSIDCCIDARFYQYLVSAM